MRDREPKKSPPTESLRFFDEIFDLVLDLSEDDLPLALVRILEAARSISGISSGTACLFDYISNELIAVGGKEASRRISLGDVNRDLPSRGLPVNRTELLLSVGSPGKFLASIPVTAGTQKLGELCIVSAQDGIALDRRQKELLSTLARLAAMALDRAMRDREARRLNEWLEVSSRVYKASRVPRSVEEVDLLLQELANDALAVSRADLVVLYEFVESEGDVRLPPRFAGVLRDSSVLERRGVAVAHRRSSIFRLLEAEPLMPFFAEDAATKWRQAGLIDAETDTSSFIAREGVVSSAGIPLRIDNERVGILFVNYRRAQEFSAEFRRHLEQFAHQMALAIGNAQFFLRSERYRQDLEALNRIGRELGSGSVVSRDIEKIGELIDRQIGQVIETKNFFLCIYERDLNRFTLPYLRDEHEVRRILEPQLHAGLTGYVCRTGRPLFGDRETKKRLFEEGEVRPVGEPAAIWLGAPMIVRDEVVGALVVQDYQEETFNEGHLKLLEAIAAQAAIAIDNFRLLRGAERRLDELSALLTLSHEFGSRDASATVLLSSILQQICKLSSCDSSLLLLVDPADPSKLVITAASESLKTYIGKTMELEQGLSGLVYRTGIPQIENDYRSWKGRGDLFDPPPAKVCGVPLELGGNVIGVMTLASDTEVGKFTPLDTEMLQRFAGPAASAVRNLRERAFRDALIQAGPNAIIAVDLKGKVTHFNEEAASLFQYASEDVLGESVARLYWGKDDAHRIQALLLEKGKVREEEVFGRSSKGVKIPLLLAGALLKDERGTTRGSVGILEDLRLQSLRGRTQLLVDALREISEEEDLGSIAQHIVDAAVTLLYADAGSLFLRQRDTFELRYSFPGGDVQESPADSRDLSSLAAADPSQIVFFPEEAQVAVLHALPNTSSSVLVPIHTDKRLLAFLLIESSQDLHFHADQELVEVLASQAAVSINRVQLLEFREKTQQSLLVSANAITVGQIATSFVHEAKNALNGMSLVVQSLRESLDEEPELGKKKLYLERLSAVKFEIDRFDNLSRRLQRFTRQGLRPEKKEAYVNEIVARTMDLLGSALRAANMKWEGRLDQSLDHPSKGKGNPIVVDEYQIQQVLMNLILNAIGAAPARSLLVIETYNREEYAEIRVTDHGAGIPGEVRRKLFKPFFTTKEEGVGLGLFLSRLLVEQNHGGKIEIVSSVPGKGSTFAVHLPKPN